MAEADLTCKQIKTQRLPWGAQRSKRPIDPFWDTSHLNFGARKPGMTATIGRRSELHAAQTRWRQVGPPIRGAHLFVGSHLAGTAGLVLAANSGQ